MARKKKRDEGIARLPTGLLIPEELRDKLRRRDWSKPTEHAGFNPDIATTKELEEHQFSGYRVNNFTNDCELWCVGKVLSRRSMQDIDRNPGLLGTMHEEAFATNGTVIEIPIDVDKLQQVAKRQRRKHGKPRSR